ncbi:unnamed protein product [Arabidopsis halleri]
MASFLVGFLLPSLLLAGALTLVSVLLYPKALGGGLVFSGWIPFNSSIINQFTEDAKKTPILWSHGIDDKTVLLEAGQAALPFLQQAGVTCELKKEDGTFHTAAIGVLMELIGATAVYSAGGSHVSVDLNYSLYSTAKIQEEVKIEARLVGKKEDLNAAIIEIRRDYDEELIATGRLWMRLLMTSFNLYVKLNGVDQVSKL